MCCLWKVERKSVFFGIGSAKFVYSGLGSGAIDTSKTTSPKDALEAEGFQVNPDLYSVYEKSEARVGKEEDPSTYLDSVEKSIKEYNDAAIVVISRNGAEAQDLSEDQLSLSDAEMSLVKYANDNFDDVIVMLNTANAIEMGWSDSRFFPEHQGLYVGWIPRTGRNFIYRKSADGRGKSIGTSCRYLCL